MPPKECRWDFEEKHDVLRQFIMNRHPENCEYRSRVREQSGLEIADCLLLAAITGTSGTGLCIVGRGACESCCATFPPTSDDFNPVLASLLYKVAGTVVELGGVPGCSVNEAEKLQWRAEATLSSHVAAKAGTVACDVVLCCDESTSQTDRAVQSVLDQKGADVFLHLVDDGGGGAEIVGRYAGLNHVFSYTNPIRRGALRHAARVAAAPQVFICCGAGSVYRQRARTAPIRRLNDRGLRRGDSGGTGENSLRTHLSPAAADGIPSLFAATITRVPQGQLG